MHLQIENVRNFKICQSIQEYKKCKRLKYGLKYRPWRFRHYVIGILLYSQHSISL